MSDRKPFEISRCPGCACARCRVAEVLDRVATEIFGVDDWASFKQAARRSVAKSDPAAQREPEDLN